MWQLKKLWSPSLKLRLMMIPGVLVLTGFLARLRVSPWQQPSQTITQYFATNLNKFPSNVSVQIIDGYQEKPAAVRPTSFVFFKNIKDTCVHVLFFFFFFFCL